MLAQSGPYLRSFRSLRSHAALICLGEHGRWLPCSVESLEKGSAIIELRPIDLEATEYQAKCCHLISAPLAIDADCRVEWVARSTLRATYRLGA